MTLDIALDIRAELGECPIWSDEEQALYFVDIKGRALHRFDPASGDHAAIAVPEEIGCVGFNRQGGFIAGLRSGLWLLDAAGGQVRKLADNPEDQRISRFNDGRVDPAGRFLAGTIDETRLGANAHLYRYDSRGLHALAGGLLTSNGVAFSPDGRTLYHADTPTFSVFRYAYDPATGEATDRTEFLRLPSTGEDRGRPDGAAVDEEGCYWTALYEGGRIQKYAPDGRLLAEYPVPARCPTMVAFGDSDRRTLYVTSARANRPADELAILPHSGSLFSMRVEVPGLRESRFDPTL
jgi:sugar lactone lactonase YvrE